MENDFENAGQELDNNLDSGAGNENNGQELDTGNNNGGSGEFSFDIPDEYKEKEWAKGFEGKSGDELKSEIFKALDEKYTNTPEIPQSVEEYALNEVEFKNDQGDTLYQYPPEVLDHFGNEFKEMGLTKDQAQGLLQKYTQFELEQFQALTNIDDLNKSIDEMFKNNPAQKQTVQGLLKEFLPAEDQQFLQETAPNYVIEMFYKVAKGLEEKYGYKENAGGQSNPNNFRMSQADKDKEYDRIVSEMEALQKRPHTTEEKQALQNQLNALFN